MSKKEVGRLSEKHPFFNLFEYQVASERSEPSLQLAFSRSLYLRAGPETTDTSEWWVTSLTHPLCLLARSLSLGESSISGGPAGVKGWPLDLIRAW